MVPVSSRSPRHFRRDDQTNWRCVATASFDQDRHVEAARTGPRTRGAGLVSPTDVPTVRVFDKGTQRRNQTHIVEIVRVRIQ